MTPKDCLLNKIQDLEEMQKHLTDKIEYHTKNLTAVVTKKDEVLKELAQFKVAVEKL